MISGIISGIISSILVSIFFLILTEYQKELEETGKMIEPLYRFQSLREFTQAPLSMSWQEFLNTPLMEGVSYSAKRYVSELEDSFSYLEEWKFHYELRKFNKKVKDKVCDIDTINKIMNNEIAMLCDEFKLLTDEFEKYNRREFEKYFILRVVRNNYIWILIVSIVLLSIFVNIIL